MAAQRRESPTSTAARLGRVEARLEGLEGDLHGIRKALERMDERRERSTPNALQLLAALGTAVAIAAVVVRLGATGYLEALARHETELTANRAAAIEAAADRGRAAAQLEERARRIERLEEDALAVKASRFSREHGEDLRSEFLEEIRRLRLELKGDVQRVADDLAEHDDGHPARVVERVNGLLGRLEVLEAHERDRINRERSDGGTSGR